MTFVIKRVAISNVVASNAKARHGGLLRNSPGLKDLRRDRVEREAF